MNWLESLKRIHAIAKTGLHYTEGEYDRDRYEQLKEITENLLETYTNLTPEKIDLALNNGQNGYVTPKVDVRGIVFKDGKILMIKEKIDSKWALPGGWADIGYSPSEIAQKEVWEEAGVKVKPKKVIAIFDKAKNQHPPDIFYTYKIFIWCDLLEGDPKPGMETLDARYFGPNELPELSTERNTKEQILHAFRFLENPDKETHFD
ncbi:MAG: NUDIX hydrolase [Bacteroidales bacterium]|nr:NUDIX hydrolase [Bacteroidales bacterium]